ncbi:MAG TPA: hypothetical protein PKY81_12910, partial [bacterium]|nr:hypothetical protein [bacterium]
MDQTAEIINVLLSYEVITQEQIDAATAKIEELNAKQISEISQGLEKEAAPVKISLEEMLVQLNYITWEHIA